MFVFAFFFWFANFLIVTLNNRRLPYVLGFFSDCHGQNQTPRLAHVHMPSAHVCTLFFSGPDCDGRADDARSTRPRGCLARWRGQEKPLTHPLQTRACIVCACMRACMYACAHLCACVSTRVRILRVPCKRVCQRATLKLIYKKRRRNTRASQLHRVAV
jgi:hypothetical protein